MINGFYFITDRKTSEKYDSDVVTDCRIALEQGVKIIQYREKERVKLGDVYLLETAQKIHDFCRRYGASFIMNDYVDLARAVDADGVHLGQSDGKIQEAKKILGKEKIVGVTCASLDHARAAEQQHADYLSVGSIYSTSTKQNAIIIGVETLKSIHREMRIPLVVIGGITFANMHEILPYCDGIAMISGIYERGAFAENITKFYSMYTYLKQNI